MRKSGKPKVKEEYKKEHHQKWKEMAGEVKSMERCEERGRNPRRAGFQVNGRRAEDKSEPGANAIWEGRVHSKR